MRSLISQRCECQLGLGETVCRIASIRSLSTGSAVTWLARIRVEIRRLSEDMIALRKKIINGRTPSSGSHTDDPMGARVIPRYGLCLKY